MNDAPWPRPTREQRDYQERIAKKRDHVALSLCNGLKFWRVCDKRCRRARSCLGDERACFERYWPFVPEEVKIHLRAVIKARVAGLSPQEALRAADAEVARQNELAAKIDARGSSSAAASQAENPGQPREEQRGPRVRML